MRLRETTRQMRLQAWFALSLFAFSLVACVAPDAALDTTNARLYPQADRLFHADPRWLGGDAAISVPLSPRRTLWLFGDSFIASANVSTRASAAFIRNTIAIESGDDPRTASMAFHWRRNARGLPASYFPDARGDWYWPGGAIRVGAPLVIFLERMRATPGHGLGFEGDGYAIAIVTDPDAAPDHWAPRIIDEPRLPFNTVPAAAVIREGDYVVALAIRQKGTHAGALVRYRAEEFALGNLSRAQWWTGDARGWVRTAQVGKRGPAFIIDDAGAECSLHWDARAHSYVHIASYGFGASIIGMRTASALIGPWSAPRMILRPPESNGAHPFVYAGKAHPELVGRDVHDLLVTYVPNSFTSSDLLTPEGQQSLYWPHFAVLPAGNLQK